MAATAGPDDHSPEAINDGDAAEEEVDPAVGQIYGAHWESWIAFAECLQSRGWFKDKLMDLTDLRKEVLAFAREYPRAIDGVPKALLHKVARIPCVDSERIGAGRKLIASVKRMRHSYRVKEADVSLPCAAASTSYQVQGKASTVDLMRIVFVLATTPSDEALPEPSMIKILDEALEYLQQELELREIIKNPKTEKQLVRARHKKDRAEFFRQKDSGEMFSAETREERALQAMRPGDWICGHLTCRQHNYSKNKACYRCKRARPAEEAPPDFTVVSTYRENLANEDEDDSRDSIPWESIRR